MDEFDDTTVFRVCLGDFETILGRKLSVEEQDKILNKFNIEDWSEHVTDFLDIYEIK